MEIARSATAHSSTAPAILFFNYILSGGDLKKGGGWSNTRRSSIYRKTTHSASSNHMEKVLVFTGILSNKANENHESNCVTVMVPLSQAMVRTRWRSLCCAMVQGARHKAHPTSPLSAMRHLKHRLPYFVFSLGVGSCYGKYVMRAPIFTMYTMAGIYAETV
ncbi:unnamed protein product [Eruca vesicaria subsp. sativa]|uniref:Pectin acetylesterase n=1 Tax=Eruca vesicaria subsp. sativa TaxID=29727 RepID=A0ABC8K074_ERUVS|nr:unnamed protein product [Eruca vesicaria subsp. sativa]